MKSTVSSPKQKQIQKAKHKSSISKAGFIFEKLDLFWFRICFRTHSLRWMDFRKYQRLHCTHFESNRIFTRGQHLYRKLCVGSSKLVVGTHWSAAQIAWYKTVIVQMLLLATVIFGACLGILDRRIPKKTLDDSKIKIMKHDIKTSEVRMLIRCLKTNLNAVYSLAGS